MDSSSPTELLERARAGDQDALGELIANHRALLQQMALRQIDGRLNARLSASDVVQQTCLSAIRHFSDFNGESESQFLAWLKAIHERNVRDVIRRHVIADKRAIAGEESLQSDIPQRRSGSSASQQAVLGESVSAVMDALNQLPSAQADAIRLRFLEQMSLRMISQKMDRSEVAVAALLKRGLAGLRTVMPGDSTNS